MIVNQFFIKFGTLFGLYKQKNIICSYQSVNVKSKRIIV